MNEASEGAPKKGRKRKGRHPDKALTAAFVRHASPGRHCDGNGLYLHVDPSGARRWVQRLRVRGKSRAIGLGGCALVTLAEARAAALENRKTARAGGDPLAARRAARVPTFAEAVEKVIEMRRADWTDDRSEAQWRASMRDHAFKRLGARLVCDIDRADVMAVLEPIWGAKRETAKRVRQRIDAVMKWSIAKGFRDDNPVVATGAVLAKAGNGRRHHAALPWAEVPAAVEAIRTCAAPPAARLALEFLVLTAARSGEVRGARWDEIDRDAATWTIPAARMKGRREHRVPLSARALAILEEAKALGGGSGLVFPSARAGREMQPGQLAKAMAKAGLAATAHGFRSSFRDWGSERTNAPRAVMEAALAHTIPNAAEAAYARSDLFEKRRDLMDRWAAFIAGEAGRVVSLARNG